MLNKMLLLVGIISFVGTIIFFIYKEGENKGKLIEIKENQEIEIKIQNEIIEEKHEVVKRKAINRAVSTNNNLVWLQQNRCKDC